MNLDKKYIGLDEKEYNILEMVQKYPEWAANRVQEGEKAINILRYLKNEFEHSGHPCCPTCDYCDDYPTHEENCLFNEYLKTN